jgi:hypothetical protein
MCLQHRSPADRQSLSQLSSVKSVLWLHVLFLVPLQVNNDVNKLTYSNAFNWTTITNTYNQM